MSDIKYILAAAENGEHTRFPCLAVVRYAAATVVTALALAVIALVIHAVLRSEDIRLSVNDGYIGADNLWSKTFLPMEGTETNTVVAGPAHQGRGRGRSNKGHDRDATAVTLDDSELEPELRLPPAAPTLGMSGGRPTRQATLQPAKVTNLLVTLIANNPGGRTKIECNDTTVSLIDIQGFEIGTLHLGYFVVPAQTTITFPQRLKIDDPATLTHIWNFYGGEISFGVNVWVNTSVTSYPLGKKTTKTRTYMCRYVTVGLTDSESSLVAADNAECRG